MTDSGNPDKALARLALFLSEPHACNYLPEEMASSLFVDPDAQLTAAGYSRLARMGFRRSGNYVYVPHCESCSACKPLRVPVAEFRPRRSQRRVWKRNQDIEVLERPAGFAPSHFKLYRKYLASRHPDGDMQTDDPARYLSFLTSQWSDTRFFEFRLDNQVVMVSVVDLLGDSLSALYTFFDPELEARSLGVFSVLWLIEDARQQGLDWLYLGYWIESCRKMAYKIDYQPCEIYHNAEWRRWRP